jgi:Pvc16 N-terminal domain
VATYRAVAAVSRAILKLLEDGCPRDEFPDTQFDLRQALDFQKTPPAEGASLLLYRVAITSARRNLPPRVERDGRRFRAALPLDLYYALCVWGRNADVQQRLLGFCARALEDTPTLPSGLLNHHAPEPTTFRPEETVQVVPDTLSMMDFHQLLDLLKPNVPLAMTYVARMVPLDSHMLLNDAATAYSRAFDMAGGPA